MEKLGILDSGIGGISTCYAILQEFKNIGIGIDIIYYADNKNSPYGTKTIEKVKQHVFDAVEFIISKKVKTIVLACNTATAVALDDLRTRFKNINFIGMEPAIKTAYLNGGKTLLLATPLTLKSSKYLSIMKNNDIINIDTKNLACDIEQMAPNFAPLNTITYNLLVGVKEIKNVVLGCSHYSFIAPYIKANFPDLNIFDSNSGVAKQVKKYFKKPNNLGNFFIDFNFSGKDETIKYYKTLEYLINNN